MFSQHEMPNLKNPNYRICTGLSSDQYFTYQNAESNSPIAHTDDTPHTAQFHFHDEEMQDLFHRYGCPAAFQTLHCNNIFLISKQNTTKAFGKKKCR